MQRVRVCQLLITILCLHCRSALSLQCYCNGGDCNEGRCRTDDDEFGMPYCELQVNVFHNGSIEGSHWFCVSDILLHCTSTYSQPDNRTNYVVHSACCLDDGLCSRCIIPESLPNSIKAQIPYPKDCNHTFSSSLLTTPTPTPTLPLTPLLVASPKTNSTMGSSPNLSIKLLYAIVGLACMVVLILITAILVILFVWHKRRQHIIGSGSLDSLPVFDDLIEATMSSGSGAGQRLLEQRTIARQIKKIEIIGKGRYGEVWLGDWGGEKVAVKIFTSQDEDSWKREGDIYRTYMLHHENIARFIACDRRPYNLGLELWMVMEYHSHGSLFEFLLSHTLSPHQSQMFVFSIASGLHYLHIDIQTGEQVKPGIAHRDLKSKNILVKNDGSCCISDFGLAVRHIGSTGHIDLTSINPRQGTKRYMAPEVLDGSICSNNFEAYKMVDMYSLGLMVWEIARRTGNKAEEYQLPYYQCVSHDPSIDDMRKIVVTEKMRPSIERWWRNDELLSLLSSLMTECWRPNPWARLSALRVKKTLLKKGLDKFEHKNGFSNHTHNHTSYA